MSISPIPKKTLNFAKPLSKLSNNRYSRDRSQALDASPALYSRLDVSGTSQYQLITEADSDGRPNTKKKKNNSISMNLKDYL